VPGAVGAAGEMNDANVGGGIGGAAPPQPIVASSVVQAAGATGVLVCILLCAFMSALFVQPAQVLAIVGTALSHPESDRNLGGW